MSSITRGEGDVDGKRIQAEKRKRWEAKQEGKRKHQRKQEERNEWFLQHKEYATFVTEEDVRDLLQKKEDKDTTTTNTSTSTSDLSALLQPYINLQEGSHLKKQAGPGLFIAEGTATIRLLIQQSSQPSTDQRRQCLEPIEIKSLFLKPSILFDEPVHLLHDINNNANSNAASSTQQNTRPPPFHILVGEEKSLSNIAGFQISRGALACGLVPQNRTEKWLMDDYLLNFHHDDNDKDDGKPLRLLALDGISDTANLGSMIRCASAFGVTAIILSQDSCDPWYRRSVRVSMGHVFHVPCVRVTNLAQTLQTLAEKYNTVSFAAVIDRDADLVLEHVEPGEVSKSWCCVMGNEANGISQPVVDACTHKLRIDMEPNVDSLSVPIATGILLHGLKARER